MLKRDRDKLPVKRRDLLNTHMDSTIWNDFKFRPDDVIIATYAKAGTTWTQQIVGQLLHGPDPDLDVSKVSPWVDFRFPVKEQKLRQLDEIKGRRFLKTHLPVDALVFSEHAKYIYVGRDGRDVCWSLYNHHANANDLWYSLINDTPGRVGPPINKPTEDIYQYYRDWFEKGYPFWSFWESVKTWWEIKDLPNVLFVHFNDLKRDMPGEIRRIAQFLGVDVDEEAFATVIKYCTFEWMKENSEKVSPAGGAFWNGGPQKFMNKGVNGRWQSTLTDEDCKLYEEKAIEELGIDCAKWLSFGNVP